MLLVNWHPGAGARTLVPVHGLVYANSFRVLWVYGNGIVRVCTDSGVVLESEPVHRTGPLWYADLTDRATFLLALDELARRVGLDAAAGVGWWRDPKRGDWWLVLPGGARDQYFPGIDTADPVEALDRALWATTPKEGA